MLSFCGREGTLMDRDDLLLEVKNMTKKFPLSRSGPFEKKKYVDAVKDFSISLKRKEIFGLVGESGCGKSTAARTIIRLYKPDAGKIIYDGTDITDLKKGNSGHSGKRCRWSSRTPIRLSIRGTPSRRSSLSR
jgi:ABC-type oligopeptide transport system ATPase subunit